MDTAGLVFGYGQNKDGSLDLQTEDRCLRAAELYLYGEISRIFICAGVVTDGHLMAHKMRDYLCMLNVPFYAVSVYPYGFNTAGEIDVCLLQLKYLAEVAAPVQYKKIIAVSSWYHLRRIKMLFRKRGWDVGTFGACMGVKVSDVCKEQLKFLNSFLRPFGSARFTRFVVPW